MSSNNVLDLLDEIECMMVRSSPSSSDDTAEESASDIEQVVEPEAGFDEWREQFVSEVESVTGDVFDESSIDYPLVNLYRESLNMDYAVQQFLNDYSDSKPTGNITVNTFSEWSVEVNKLLSEMDLSSLDELRDSGFMSAKELHSFFMEHKSPVLAVRELFGDQHESPGMTSGEIDDFRRMVDDLDLDEEDGTDDAGHEEQHSLDSDEEIGLPTDFGLALEDVKSEVDSSHGSVNPNNIENLMGQVIRQKEELSDKDKLTQESVPDMLDIDESENVMDMGIMSQAADALKTHVIPDGPVPEVDIPLRGTK